MLPMLPRLPGMPAGGWAVQPGMHSAGRLAQAAGIAHPCIQVSSASNSLSIANARNSAGRKYWLIAAPKPTWHAHVAHAWQAKVAVGVAAQQRGVRAKRAQPHQAQALQGRGKQDRRGAGEQLAEVQMGLPFILATAAAAQQADLLAACGTNSNPPNCSG